MFSSGCTQLLVLYIVYIFTNDVDFCTKEMKCRHRHPLVVKASLVPFITGSMIRQPYPHRHTKCKSTMLAHPDLPCHWLRGPGSWFREVLVAVEDGRRREARRQFAIYLSGECLAYYYSSFRRCVVAPVAAGSRWRRRRRRRREGRRCLLFLSPRLPLQMERVGKRGGY